MPRAFRQSPFEPQKQLHDGWWFYIHTLPVGTSDADLVQFFAACGINLPLSHVSVRDKYHFDEQTGQRIVTSTSARISIEKKHLEPVLNWLLAAHTMNGWRVELHSQSWIHLEQIRAAKQFEQMMTGREEEQQ